jgi:hypothetical protein
MLARGWARALIYSQRKLTVNSVPHFGRFEFGPTWMAFHMDPTVMWATLLVEVAENE